MPTNYLNFHKIKYDFNGQSRPLQCYGEVALLLKTFRSFDQITTFFLCSLQIEYCFSILRIIRVITPFR